MEKYFTNRYALIVLLSLPFLMGAAPSSTYTYQTGQVIQPNEVQQNETNIYNYLSTGVDTIADGSIVNADIASGADIAASKLDTTVVETDTTQTISGTKTFSGTANMSGTLQIGGTAVTSSATELNLLDGKTVIGDVLYSDSRFYIGTFTRDMSLASGNVAYTGVGFQPKAIIFISRVGAVASLSWGFDNATNTENINIRGAATSYEVETTRSIFLQQASGDTQTALIASMDADGFTLTWTKTGTPTATATIIYLAFR